MIYYIKPCVAVLLKPSKAWAKPVHIQLEPTNNCNLRCKMCTRDKQIKKTRNMTLKEFKHIIDSIEPKRITLSGFGEPFLNKDLIDMIKYAKSKKLYINTCSNFTLPDREMLERIVDSKLDLIKISIDSAKKDTYKKIRGQDYFEKIVDNIKILNEIKKKRNSDTPLIRLQFVIQNDNYREISEVIKLSSGIGIDGVYFQRLQTIGLEDQKEDKVGDLDMRKDTLKKILMDSNKVAKKLRVDTNLPILINDFDIQEDYEGKIFNRLEMRCHYPWFSTYISANGDIKPCCTFAWTNDQGIMGNIFEENFESIWNGKRYKLLRSQFKKNIKSYEICQHCMPPNFFKLFKIFNKLSM